MHKELKLMKRLCGLTVFTLCLVTGVEIYSESMTYIQIIPRSTSIYFALGAWHIIRDAEVGKSGSPFDLFVWPKRYFSRK